MKMKFLVLLATFALTGLSGPIAAQGIVETVQKGCATEIEAFCSQVSPGEGRLLACFYAHEDKLSGQCQYALYSASAQLIRASQTIFDAHLDLDLPSLDEGEYEIRLVLRTADRSDAVSTARFAVRRPD